MMAIFQSTGYLGNLSPREETGGETETFRSEKTQFQREQDLFIYIFLIGAKYLFQVEIFVVPSLEFCCFDFCVCFGCSKLEVHERYVQN